MLNSHFDTKVTEADFEPLPNVLTVKVVDDMFIASGTTYLDATEFSVPEGYTSIGPGAFKDCGNLKYIYLPDSIRYIGQSAFENCTSLEQVKLPRNLEFIDEYAFRSCESLQNVNFDNGGHLRVIGAGAFEDCYSFTELYFPGSIELIENGAFCHCRELKKIRFAKRGLRILGVMSFGRCRRLWKFKESWFPKTLENRDSRWEAFVDSTASFKLSLRKIRYYRHPHTNPYIR